MSWRWRGVGGVASSSKPDVYKRQAAGGGRGDSVRRIALRHRFTPVARGIFHLDINNKKFESIYKMDGLGGHAAAAGLGATMNWTRCV